MREEPKKLMTTENSAQVELPKNFLQKGTRSEHSKNDFQIHVTNSITPSRDFISSRDNSMLKLVIVVSKLLERSPLNSPCFYLLNSNLALFGTRSEHSKNGRYVVWRYGYRSSLSPMALPTMDTLHDAWRIVA